MTLRLRDGVRWIRVDDGMVIFVPDTGAFLDLNETATIVFESLQRHRWSEAATCEQLEDDYDINPTAAAAAVDEAVTSLVQRRVLEHDQ